METIDIREQWSQLRERFYKDCLTSEDKKHVYVYTRMCKHGKNPWGGKCYYVGNEYLYLSGEFKCHLDKESKLLALSNKTNSIRCKVLILREGAPLGLERSGFYFYNSDRILPDSVLALKPI